MFPSSLALLSVKFSIYCRMQLTRLLRRMHQLQMLEMQVQWEEILMLFCPSGGVGIFLITIVSISSCLWIILAYVTDMCVIAEFCNYGSVT